MPITTRETHACCGGTVGYYSHLSDSLGLEARFAVFVPDGASDAARVPVLHVLAGLTCTEETFLIKANAIRFAAEYGIALVATDTSPRGAGIAGEDDSYDFGSGAGFYLDATQAPWAAHYRMGRYVAEELPALTEAHFPLDGTRRGIMGHSMGGHGALVHALRAPDRWKSVSAFAPIVHPAAVPWGEKAFSGYLGPDRATWAAHDATLLLRAGRTHPTTILVDQGEADPFLPEQLQPWHLEEAAKAAGQGLILRRHAGYDHSYWFIQSFIQDHLTHHAAILRR
ncbi:S-formylglutathione hydrolase [Gluconacetobacter diazotrophicus PA1 5]|uniref:S-formylglutathione hydrolase n=2 Tax=Gluconacetobacter diazotrophicus TaxID=33996 RepID=A9HIP3_GLUDA|nr:S-formylglutathione hydrolase [Gluconacetobacter diazotrophicus]ACI49880.1 S-formylglutathione hydrolase [Gluconacetobacter diazotrophicus PA1 5]MBB2155791.1 S-formylglutathione hydrolase [Gluconacetobacter diazotrophicus]TWB10269.1 S-formylglutathione hydrolase [Gluconacetobacter diazotrophicus]CAP55796.1 Esterase protein [Gluconacetobacter diazotrophicus PA1 5]